MKVTTPYRRLCHFAEILITSLWLSACAATPMAAPVSTVSLACRYWSPDDQHALASELFALHVSDGSKIHALLNDWANMRSVGKCGEMKNDE